MRAVVEVQATVRKRNQITIPAEAVERLDLHEGDTVVFAIGDSDATIRPLPASFSGALQGVYGSSAEVAKFVAGERAAWD